MASLSDARQAEERLLPVWYYCKSPLLVDMRRSKTSLLRLPMFKASLPLRGRDCHFLKLNSKEVIHFNYD